MAKPLAIITQHYEYPLKPAALELCDAIAVRMAVTADPARLAVLNRIYLNLTPAAKGRCDLMRSWLAVSA